MKIDLLVAENLYGTTAFFAKSLFRAFREMGVEARWLPIDAEYFFHTFQKVTENPPDITCSFSDIRMGSRPLAELWQIPHLSLLLDPAIYFLHQLKSPLSLISCVDEGDVRLIHKLGFSNSFFLPHAADEKEFCPPDSKRAFKKVFFGSCIDIEEVEKRWNGQYSKKEQDILYEACKLVLTAEEISCFNALTLLGVCEEALPLFHYEVDLYTRGKDRIELLKKYPAEIWGEGPWAKYLPSHSIHPKVSFDKCIEIMKRSEIVLNSSPRFKEGSHERIFYALMCGSCPLTMDNSFIRKNFDHEELSIYQCGVWEARDDLSTWQEKAFKGQKKVAQAHTWKERAKTILDKISYFI